MATAESPWLPLGEGDGSPIVFVYNSIGDLTCYRDVAAHLSSPTLGLRPPALQEDLSLSDIASGHIPALLSGEPPLALVGWGFGGVLAVELAALLAERSLDVPAVVIESAAPQPAWASRETDDQSLRSVYVRHKALWAGKPIPEVESDGDLQDWEHRAASAISESEIVVRAEFATFCRLVRALVRHRPRERTRLQVIEGVAERVDGQRRYPLGWEHYVEQVVVSQAPGDHFTVVRHDPPRLAQAIVNAIRADAPTRPSAGDSAPTR